jgi:transposase-like protein
MTMNTIDVQDEQEQSSTDLMEVAEQLVSTARSRGVELTGPKGLLSGLTKQVLETALGAELEEHLGHDRGKRSGTGNVRNGSSAKTVRTDIGEVRIDVPRDRAGTFAPMVVPKHSRRLAGFDDAVLSLYAKGMTTGDIANHLADVYGTEVSRDLVSRVTDAVIEEMKQWQSRPLDACYPVVLIDAIFLKIRDGQVRNRPVYVAMGISVDGERDVLGLWAGPSGGEGAKQWMSMLTELRNRGLADVCIVCCDGLKGLPDAIAATWPLATVQTSSIDTGWRRDGLAGHRATRRGPMQTRAFEALMQTCPSWWRRAA